MRVRLVSARLCRDGDALPRTVAGGLAAALALASVTASAAPQAAAGNQAAGNQAAGPAVAEATPDPRRAVLLADADFFATASSDGAVVARLPAGTVLDFVGETTDSFLRTWSTLRHPERLARSRRTYLTNLDARRITGLGFEVAVLADRQPVLVPARPQRAVPGAPLPPPEPAWWEPVATIGLGESLGFAEVLGISARAPAEADVAEVIDLLGGMAAIATWPEEATPGELFVPSLLPLLFQYDGELWELVRPVRLLGSSLSLLGNPDLAIDPLAPTVIGGPVLPCWTLVGVVDPSGALAGSVQEAPPVQPARGGRSPLETAPGTDEGPSQMLAQILAPLPPALRVPPRLDPPSENNGIVLEDSHSLQAVYLAQTLGPLITHRLRGRSMAIDLVTRNPPRSAAAATFGISVEVRFVDGRPPVSFGTSLPTTPEASHTEFLFDVPPEADSIAVRLLAADASLAVEQRGSVIFERAALRPASWKAEPPGATVILHRIAASSMRGAPIHTRAPIVLTTRDAAVLAEVWPRVAAADWSSEDKQRVLAGEIRNGMFQEQVRLAWGEPRASRQGDDGQTESWDYADRSVSFVSGRVIAFRTPRRPAADDPPEPMMCPSGIVPLAAGASR